MAKHIRIIEDIRAKDYLDAIDLVVCSFLPYRDPVEFSNITQYAEDIGEGFDEMIEEAHRRKVITNRIKQAKQSVDSDVQPINAKRE